MGEARDFLPDQPRPSLAALRTAAEDCRGCDLNRRAPHTVFGEGAPRARSMFVGEQPGDREDRAGRPFVGSAGALLDRAIADADIPRRETCVTNAAKHFKWTAAPRGRNRIHAKPNYQQIRACRPWLEAELRLVRPAVLVLLGATAAQGLLGSSFGVTRQRGQVIADTAWAPAVVATLHPSAILRARGDAARHRHYGLFVDDLRVVRAAAEAGARLARRGGPHRDLQG